MTSIQHLFFWDTETALIAPGLNAPPMSCMSACFEEGNASLLHWTEAGAYFEKILDDAAIGIVGANIAFDLAVMAANFPLLLPKIFRAFDQDRVFDVLIRQKLIDIGDGSYPWFRTSSGVTIRRRYDLDSVTRRHSEMRLDKDDAVRRTYGPLRNVPLSMWPPAHIKYAAEDALATRACFFGQSRKNPALLVDQHNQCKYDFALRLMSTWGLRTDESAVVELERNTVARYEAIKTQLVAEGLVREDGSRDTKRAKDRMMLACGFQHGASHDAKAKKFSYESIPTLSQKKMHLTDSGDVSLSADACDDSEDPILQLYGEYGEQKSVLSKDVKALMNGVHFPLHTHFGMAASGRSTSSNPNVQNWRRLPGIREAFRPRKGRVYAQADVEGLELATLAQACYEILGYSKLGDAINSGIDVHTDLASSILNVTYEEAIRRKKLGNTPHVKVALDFEQKHARLPEYHEVNLSEAQWQDYQHYSRFVDARQAAKVANFGFPGGLGIKNMILFAKATYGVILSEERCQWLKNLWLTKWSEMTEYFAWINSQIGPDDEAYIEQIRSKRIRGGCSYCAAANTIFQGLGADATKWAAWLIAKECYLDTMSPLYGARPVNYVHDEFIVEVDDNDRAHDAAVRLEQIMVNALRPWIPNVRVAAPPLLMRLWSKNAKAVHNEQGRLIPWS